MEGENVGSNDATVGTLYDCRAGDVPTAGQTPPDRDWPFEL